MTEDGRNGSGRTGLQEHKLKEIMVLLAVAFGIGNVKETIHVLLVGFMVVKYYGHRRTPKKIAELIELSVC